MRAWLDFDNAPQVQYLLPVAKAFRDGGDELVLTARDHGITLELLEQSGTPFVRVGSAFGASRTAKARGVLSRSATLWRLMRRYGKPDILVSSSRTSAIVARALGIPAFILCDYEHVDLRLYRISGSWIVYPNVIPERAFVAQGFSPQRLVGFVGLKEDLSFASYDLDAVRPYRFAESSTGRKIVVFRPPAEESHYHAQSSANLAMDALRWFAGREDVTVVFSPRYRWQRQMIESCSWSSQPIVLERPIPFLELLKGADAVVSAGGTMLREAAYLGVQAVSVFRGKLGAVDAHLARIGRLQLIESAQTLDTITIGELPREPLPRRPTLPAELVALLKAQMITP